MKRWVAVGISLFLITLLAGTVVGKEEVVWSFGHHHSLEHPWGKGAQMICDLVAERSQGRFIIEHYPAGILGGEFDTFDQLMVGAIELMIVGPAALGRYYEPINILQAHYVFRDLDHMFTVMRGPIGDELYQGALEATGVGSLDVWYYGTRHITTSNFPVYKPEDLIGRKIRSMDIPFHVHNIEAMGATATPVAYQELYMALQTGVVEGQENPLPSIDVMKFYEVQEYLILTGHCIHPGLLHVNDKAFQALPSDLQEILTEVVYEVTDKVTEMILAEEAKLQEKFENYGMKTIVPDVDAFRERTVANVLAKYDEIWGKGLFAKIQEVK